MLRSAPGAWPTRRLAVAAALVPVVGAWFGYVGGSAGARPGAAWYAVTLLAAVLGAAVLATYIPVAGRGLDQGCTPCATLSALTLVGATVALRSYGAEIAGPLVAGAVLIFGLAQRLSRPVTCPTPEA